MKIDKIKYLKPSLENWELEKKKIKLDDVIFQKTIAKKPEGVKEYLIVASSGDLDRDNDKIKSDGFDIKNLKKNPTFLFNHSWWGTTLPIGAILEVGAYKEKYLLMKVYFDPDDEFAQKVKRKYDKKIMNQFSIGFSADDYIYNEEHQGYDIKSFELLEVSAVVLPANPNTGIIETSKSFKGAMDEDLFKSYQDRIAKDITEKKEDIQEEAIEIDKVKEIETEESPLRIISNKDLNSMVDNFNKILSDKFEILNKKFTEIIDTENKINKSLKKILSIESDIQTRLSIVEDDITSLNSKNMIFHTNKPKTIKIIDEPKIDKKLQSEFNNIFDKEKN